MQKQNLRGLDLNLLVPLQALLEERSVTKAAMRVHLSQPDRADDDRSCDATPFAGRGLSRQ
jgi:hypothetical protein